MKPAKRNDKIFDNEEEIDIISILKTIWIGRMTIIWSLAVFAVVGIVVAMTSPKVYKAITIMVPQGQAKNGGSAGLGGLAALAGINLNDIGTGSQDLSPTVYPYIVNSYPFQKEMIHEPLKWNSLDKPISLFEFSKRYSKLNLIGTIKRYTIGLPGVVVGLFRKVKDNKGMVAAEYDSLFPITEFERALCDELSNNLTLNVDNKSGYLTLSSLAEEPLVTAQLAAKAQKLLQSRITEYRIDKAQKTLEFIEDRYEEKKKEFEVAQDRLARFRDRNLNMASNMARTEEDRLQSEYQLSFSVYSELAKQLESAKIKVKEDTPVFSIIQPVSVPFERTKPKRAQILIIYIFLGGIIGLGMIFLKSYWKSFKENWKEA